MGSFIPGDRPTDSEESAADAGSSFADVAAGPALCEMLDAVEFTELAGGDVVEVMAAAYRQHCRQHAVFLRAVLESGLRVPYSTQTVERTDQPGEFASEEVRARLAWSRTRAESTFVLAYALFVELPDLGAAMLAGDLDLPRARAFINWTEGLSDEHVHQVIGQLLPTAGDVTVGELIDEIKRACLAADPDWAEKKYAAAVRTRHVRGFRNPDGTGNLAGYAQPVDRVIAATTRIDGLARHCKRAGDRRGIDLIRSDLFLRMLDGSFEAMSDAEVVDHVLAHPLIEPSDPDPSATGHDDAEADPDSDADPDAGPDNDTGDDPWPPGGSGRPGDPHGPAGTAGPAGAAGLEPHATDESDNDPSGSSPEPVPPESSASEPAPPDSAASEPASSELSSRELSSRELSSSELAALGLASPSTGGLSKSACRSTPSAWAVPELRVQLLTVLGHDDHPGHVPGWDYLPAQLIRRLVDDMHDAQWRWVVCDADGRAIATGITRRRPSTATPDARTARAPRRGGIVELAIRAADLNGMDRASAAPQSWRPVIADIAVQYASAGHGGQPRHGRHPEEQRRMPSAGLRRWLQVRDRRCTHPYCRVPASRSDIDHRTRWADGGSTRDINLGPACRHDHRIKDEGEWTVEQLPDGTTIWRSPLGQRLISQPPPVIPATIVPVQQGSIRRPRSRFTYMPPPCTCIMQPCLHTGSRLSSSRRPTTASASEASASGARGSEASASETSGSESGASETSGSEPGASETSGSEASGSEASGSGASGSGASGSQPAGSTLGDLFHRSRKEAGPQDTAEQPPRSE